MICNVNIESEITDPQKMMDLMEYAAKCGVVYWAVNYKLHMCKNNHVWVGTSICPKCGEA